EPLYETRLFTKRYRHRCSRHRTRLVRGPSPSQLRPAPSPKTGIVRMPPMLLARGRRIVPEDEAAHRGDRDRVAAHVVPYGSRPHPRLASVEPTHRFEPVVPLPLRRDVRVRPRPRATNRDGF